MDGELCGEGFGLDGLPSLAIFAILAAFLIIIHGFASATALTAALLPILISLLSSLPPELGVNPVGMTILLAFSASFGFILPINAPQNMVCMGTDTFTPRQFTRVGLYLTVIGHLLLLLFAATVENFRSNVRKPTMSLQIAVEKCVG